MPVSLKFPEGCVAAGIGQLELIPDENGIAEIPDGIDYEELLNHGFTPCSEADLVPVRLKKQAEEEAKLNAKVQQRIDEILKGAALYGNQPPPEIVALAKQIAAQAEGQAAPPEDAAPAQDGSAQADPVSGDTPPPADDPQVKKAKK